MQFIYWFYLATIISPFHCYHASHFISFSIAVSSSCRLIAHAAKVCCWSPMWYSMRFMLSHLIFLGQEGVLLKKNLVEYNHAKYQISVSTTLRYRYHLSNWMLTMWVTMACVACNHVSSKPSKQKATWNDTVSKFFQKWDSLFTYNYHISFPDRFWRSNLRVPSQLPQMPDNIVEVNVSIASRF